MQLPCERSEFGIKHNTRIKRYPDGSAEVLCASRQIFRESGYERRDDWGQDVSKKSDTKREVSPEAAADNLLRAQRRARTAVRDLALCNPMTHFVTLTFDAAKVDRYDIKAIMRKVNSWLDNQVRRRGLAYILVPELHKDGAVHMHGLFTSSIALSDSGTMVPPNGGKPRRPRSAAQRSEWIATGGRIVYNLDGWPYGFSTAMELHGDYRAAVGYVCKYIAKEQTKVGGRWYYHGGALSLPSVSYADANVEDIAALDGAASFESPTLEGVQFAIWRGEVD
jgi:hypothetical protein